MRTSRLFSLAIATTILWSCGSEPNTSSLSYRSWSTSAIRSSLIADATKDRVNVCFEGSVSAADLERSKVWAQRGILTWFRVLKTLDDRVTSEIAFDCRNSDMTFRLRNGNGTSYASPSVTTIYMSRPYGTWTHELGHALAGLSDTYAGGAGSCQSGQPESLMCWGAYGPRANPEEWSTLWPDDIAGITHNYRTIMDDDLIAPDWASEVNLEAPLDLESPWPGTSAKIIEGSLNVEIITDKGATQIDLDPNTDSKDL